VSEIEEIMRREEEFLRKEEEERRQKTIEEFKKEEEPQVEPQESETQEGEREEPRGIPLEEIMKEVREVAIPYFVGRDVEEILEYAESRRWKKPFFKGKYKELREKLKGLVGEYKDMIIEKIGEETLEKLLNYYQVKT